MCPGADRLERSMSFTIDAVQVATQGRLLKETKIEVLSSGANKDDDPKPARARVSGYEADKPVADSTAKMFFPVLSSRYGKFKMGSANPQKAPISLITPCYNEESFSLDRTLRSLREQVLSPGLRLEVVVVMDGFAKISESMKSYLKEIFLVDVDILNRIPEYINTVIVEPEYEGNLSELQLGLSLVVKRHNKGKVDSQRWWLGSHAPAVKCDYVFQTDCGIIFDPLCLGMMHERLEMDLNVAGACCMQRTMNASQQENATGGEAWYAPGTAILRLLQQLDMEVRLCKNDRVMRHSLLYSGSLIHGLAVISYTNYLLGCCLSYSAF